MPALTTLANVKAYLNILTAGSDALISQLIARESELIEQYTYRSFPSALNIRKRVNGLGGYTIVLPFTPIIEVTSLSMNDIAVPASVSGSYGYDYVPGGSTVELVGGKFPHGVGNVTLTWRSGYRAAFDTEIPAQEGNAPVTITPSLGGRAVSDAGVTDEDGVAFSSVANAPVAGEYSFSGGVYTFNAANSGDAVTLNYDYVPAPVEQACIEMVGLDMQQRTNLGVNSKTLAGETVSYTTKGMTPSIAELLAPFRRRTPL